MNISTIGKHFLTIIDQEDETICNLMNEFTDIEQKYNNDFNDFQLIKEAIEKNFLKLKSILIEESGPIDAINIAVKLELFDFVLTIIEKKVEDDIPNKNEDYPIHIVTNHEYYDILKILLQKEVEIDVRNGNNETPLMRAIKLRNVDLIKLFVEFNADMNFIWPNTNETLFYYLTVTNPIPNYVPPYEKMDTKIISNIVVCFLVYPYYKIRKEHISNEDLLEFIIEKNLYDLLLRFNLDKMDLPFLKYKAIIHNRLDILDKLMLYNSIDNDKYEGKYSLLKAAFETSNKEAYDILENHQYFIKDYRHIHHYFIPKSFSTYVSMLKDRSKFHNCIEECIIMGFKYDRDCAHYWLKICFKRRFLRLDNARIWCYLLQKNIPLDIYANIFIDMKHKNILDIWSTLKCFASMIHISTELNFSNTQILEMYFSELMRLDYLNQLPNKTELTTILNNEYLNIKYKYVTHCVEKLKSIIIYENQTAFDFYLQKKCFKNIDILKKIKQIVEEKSNLCEIPKFISLPLIKRLERTIKKKILFKNGSLVLTQLFNWPILIRDKILSNFTRRELKLLCESRKQKSCHVVQKY